jgi:geranylgeranyl diphosphate synthase type I
MSLRETTQRYLPAIEAELRDIVQGFVGEHPAYYGMMQYHLGWMDEAGRPTSDAGGKRIRPLLCMLTCRAARGDPFQALPAACALELVHNFSLVHDDIEDRSLTRRGRRTVWDIWGIAQGINVGDGLLIMARLALRRLQGRGVPLQRIQSVAAALDGAALALCEGQFEDMAFEDSSQVDLQQYLGMIRKKTAALLSASVQIGAIIATGESEQRDLARFGERLGMAFQIQDDVLGIWGHEHMTGKSSATDLRDKKKTLPVVYALGLSPPGDATRRLSEIYSHPGPLGAADVETALKALEEVHARAYAQDMARRDYAQALESLQQAGLDPEAQGELAELAAALLKRQA